ncbi:MAG: hypothetical protein LUC96_05620 [Alistipes sp.]|uniref:hypothetical protein n=1 Tax=Alistipes sp. TaxID=1872444 RepID=UPI0025BA120B|nr:hypothetical protein [Alistipes sp.]MCD8274450.1 hypothetical protein [Alistipes sp.]
MSIRITSSWINNVAALQKDQLLGEFTINLPVNPSDLDDDGYFRYIRGCNDEPRYRIAGESFIVPRSFMGFRDQNDEYHDCWGTGEYKVSVTIKETCDITDTYRANWKADYKKRKRMKPSEGILSQGWEMVRNQHWDEMTQSWIITTLKAPAGVVSRTVNESMKYQASGQSSQNTTKGK